MIVPAMDIPRPDDVPSLSHSYESSSSSNDTLPDRTCHDSFLENSALSRSRGKEPHMTPTVLEKIITNIQEQTKLEPLDPVIEAAVNAKRSPEVLARDQKKEASPLSPVSDRSTSPSERRTLESSTISNTTNMTNNSSVSAQARPSEHIATNDGTPSDGLIRSGSVVHGFSPVPSLRSRASTQHALPILALKKAPKEAQPKKKSAFTLGGSSEDDSSFDQNMSYRRTMLAQEPRKSSLSQSLSKQQPLQAKKTSFREIVEQHQLQSGNSENDDSAIASDDEDDEISDSAVEEDEWEDSIDEEEEKSIEHAFKRVDSTAHLPSRRSILTQGLTEGDRARGMLGAATQSTSALRRMDRTRSLNGPSAATSPEQDEDGPMMMQHSRGARPMPIVSPPAYPHAAAHSPRTTRLKMLSTELTESLRKNLIWERRQKNTTVNAFLQREAKSMANLQRAGQMSQHRSRQSSDAQPATDYFNIANEYHSKGW